MNMVDIHNHLLPGVDDGAESMEESLRHLRTLYREGVRRLAVSPHLFGWLSNEERGLELRLDRLEQVFSELQHAAAAMNDLPELFFSQEILCGTPELVKAVFATSRPGVRGTRYALVEYGFDLRIDYTTVVAAVLAAGKRMIVSHPERYRRDGQAVTVDEILTWKKAGALLQVNCGSLLGDYGERIERTAWQLLQGGHADLIASDHHADNRAVSPLAAARRLISRGGQKQAELLMSENPGRILDDEDVVSVPGWEARPAA
jgi:protein-tyrosine phosphatase